MKLSDAPRGRPRSVRIKPSDLEKYPEEMAAREFADKAIRASREAQRRSLRRLLRGDYD